MHRVVTSSNHYHKVFGKRCGISMVKHIVTLAHSTYKLELVVFVSGAVVMALEISGARALAPYTGTSIYVWTSLISVVMGSLSLGYYWGGKLADSTASFSGLSKILFFSGLGVFILNLIKGVFLSLLTVTLANSKYSSLIASLVLFAPPSILLGMVSPYAVKLKMDSLKTSGRTVGNLYAISTMGSIVGTLLAGFYLISFLGTTNIIFLLSGILILLSLFTWASVKKLERIIALGLVLGAVITAYEIRASREDVGIIDVDTKYNRVWIYDSVDPETTRVVRRMNLGDQYASAMFVDGDELVHMHNKYYNLVPYFSGKIKSGLVLGGAAYSYPKEFLKRYPNAQLDVVEIDPDLTKLAQEYFNLENTPRLATFAEDARVFLNKNSKKYNAIYMDVFNTAHSIPPHVTTVETAQRVAEALFEDGAVAINIHSALTGENSGFLETEYHTYKKVFRHVYVFKVSKESPNEVQNIILIATNSSKLHHNEIGAEELEYLKTEWTAKINDSGLVLTDDFSPIEKFY